MVGPTRERPGHSELMCGDRCVALGSSRVPLSRRPARALKMFDESHRASSESEALGLPPGRQSEYPSPIIAEGNLPIWHSFSSAVRRFPPDFAAFEGPDLSAH